MRYLFLDANVYLSFFAYGKDDLEELKKLIHLIDEGEVTLHSNWHLRDEVERNREGKIKDGLADLRGLSFDRQFPNYFYTYPQFSQLRESLKNANESFRQLKSVVDEDIVKRDLLADKLIANLLERSRLVSMDSGLIERASIRVQLGNPPGKKGSIGDAIHWEALLEVQGDYDDLDIVSVDGDFYSPLDPTRGSQFLRQEYSAPRGKKFPRGVNFFRTLSDYFKLRFSHITLTQEAEKAELIDLLARSPTFAATHRIIAGLSEYSEFTSAQVRRLFAALVENDQVSKIATDPDISSFYARFKHDIWLYDPEIISRAGELIGKEKDFFDLPF